jgi:small subunit ribosomal protein S20
MKSFPLHTNPQYTEKGLLFKGVIDRIGKEIMPIIKSAKKALRQTKKRTLANRGKKIALHAQVRAFKKQKSQKSLSTIFSLVDKLAKGGVIHKNKAARIKSQLSLLVAKTGSQKKTARA